MVSMGAGDLANLSPAGVKIAPGVKIRAILSPAQGKTLATISNDISF